MVVFTDDTIANIADSIGAAEPETGGALFGPDNSNVVSLFVFDDKARTTGATYTPSEELIALIPIIEAAEGIVFKGIIHSHPGDFDCPSGPDLRAFARTLKENPQLKSVITPIVNFAMRAPDSRAIQLGDGATLRVYEAFRSRGDGRPVAIEPASARVMNIDAATQCVTEALKQVGVKKVRQTSGHCKINDSCFLHRKLSWDEDGRGNAGQLDIYFPHDFPSVGPVVSMTNSDTRRWLAINWSLEHFADDALAKSMGDSLDILVGRQKRILETMKYTEETTVPLPMLEDLMKAVSASQPNGSIKPNG